MPAPRPRDFDHKSRFPRNRVIRHLIPENDQRPRIPLKRHPHNRRPQIVTPAEPVAHNPPPLRQRLLDPHHRRIRPLPENLPRPVTRPRRESRPRPRQPDTRIPVPPIPNPPPIERQRDHRPKRRLELPLPRPLALPRQRRLETRPQRLIARIRRRDPVHAHRQLRVVAHPVRRERKAIPVVTRLKPVQLALMRQRELPLLGDIRVRNSHDQRLAQHQGREQNQ